MSTKIESILENLGWGKYQKKVFWVCFHVSFI